MKDRNTLEPVPDNWHELLTEQQLLSLATLNNFGWTIAFIRRPMFQDRTVVLHHEQQGYRLLESSGYFDKPFYALRNEDLE